jgi:hypothetical protein
VDDNSPEKSMPLQRIELTGKLENNTVNFSGKAGDADWVGVLGNGKLTLNRLTIRQSKLSCSGLCAARQPKARVPAKRCCLAALCARFANQR